MNHIESEAKVTHVYVYSFDVRVLISPGWKHRPPWYSLLSWLSVFLSLLSNIRVSVRPSSGWEHTVITCLVRWRWIWWWRRWWGKTRPPPKKNRKPLVTLYDMPWIQLCPGPHRSQINQNKMLHYYFLPTISHKPLSILSITYRSNLIEQKDCAIL